MFKKIVFYLLFTLSTNVSFAQDWPQWRGPHRDGLVASFTPPRAWPETLKPVWKVEVGIGHASPVVVGRRVYLHSRQGEEEVVAAFDLDTGKQLWRDSYAVAYQMNPAATSHGKGPKSTPVIYNDKIYTLGITGVLSCYETSGGKLKWRKEFSKQFKVTSPLYGTAASPLVVDGLVVAHVGGNDSGALAAFNADTGEVKWSWAGDGPGYASPVVFEAGGTKQIVTQTQKLIAGFELANGKLLWQIPFETEYVQNCVTPVVYKDTVILSGLDKGTMAVKTMRRGDKWETQQIWRNADVSMYLNTPVLGGDYLYGLSHKRKGQFFCLDARSGKTLWSSNGREGDNAAMVVAGQLLFSLTDGAELIVARCDPNKYEIVKKYSVAQSPTWAHPVIVGNRVLIKDVSSLALMGFE
jgi:outer membrane protein assembly factor BamB